MFSRSPQGIITMTRGDSFSFPLFINCNTDILPQRYTLQEEDVLHFRVKKPNQLFEKSVIRKSYTSSDLNEDGDVVVRFRPEDTVELLPGKYYYEVKIVNTSSATDTEQPVSSNLEVQTILPSTLFYIDD